MDRFASEYHIDGDRCSVTAFLKFVINRSIVNSTVLKLPKCYTVSWPCDFEFTRRFIGQQTHDPRADWQVEKFGGVIIGFMLKFGENTCNYTKTLQESKALFMDVRHCQL
ncbi:unnamed protein product [Prunus armeniaca]